jgi:type II secretory pathway component PulF
MRKALVLARENRLDNPRHLSYIPCDIRPTRGKLSMAPPPASLDQLIALNDELLAMARAGLPMERGLALAGQELSGRVGRIARELGGRLERGESLESALAAEGVAVPAHYRAIVLAGTRSGRLTAALEGLARVIRSAADLRREIGQAMVYPFLVAILGLVLAVFLGIWVAPRLERTVADMGFATPALFNGLVASLPIWAGLGGLGLVGAWAAWARSGRSSATAMRWIPGFRKVAESSCVSRFAEVLALLLEHGTPYAEALTLAGESSGDPALAAAAREVASRERAGTIPGGGADAYGAFPPLLRWVLSAEIPAAALIPALNHLGRSYGARARSRAEALRLLMPIAILVVVGGGAAAFFALALLIPYSRLLLNLLGS